MGSLSFVQGQSRSEECASERFREQLPHKATRPLDSACIPRYPLCKIGVPLKHG